MAVQSHVVVRLPVLVVVAVSRQMAMQGPLRQPMPVVERWEPLVCHWVVQRGWDPLGLSGHVQPRPQLPMDPMAVLVLPPVVVAVADSVEYQCGLQAHSAMPGTSTPIDATADISA